MSESNQQFDSFGEWIAKAASWLTRHERYSKRKGHEFRAICMDAKGRVCRIGADFMQADRDGAFPIRWRWPDQPPFPEEHRA